MQKLTPIHQAVQITLHDYFVALHGQPPHDLHAIITQEVEYALFSFIMTRTGNNQTMAAKWLGINRNTLRKKLEFYELLNENDSTSGDE